MTCLRLSVRDDEDIIDAGNLFKILLQADGGRYICWNQDIGNQDIYPHQFIMSDWATPAKYLNRLISTLTEYSQSFSSESHGDELLCDLARNLAYDLDELSKANGQPQSISSEEKQKQPGSKAKDRGRSKKGKKARRSRKIKSRMQD
jgi:hypothetical protein